MNTATPAIRDFAGRLIAREAARDESAGVVAGAAGRVCDRLRVPFARLAGVAGYRSLLSRALALAKAEVVSLNPVQVREDGSLEACEGAGDCPGDGPGGDGAAVVVAHLLGLMVTFIGEPLTRQLVRDAWPDEAADATNGPVGEQL
jgi:hypothetical protein